MTPVVPITDDLARAIAERLLDRRPDRIEPFRPEAGGSDSSLLRLGIAHEQLLLQVKKRPGTPVGVYFHGRLSAAGLPVPDLVAFDPKGGPNGEACALWRWVDGHPAEWSVGDPCPYDEAEFGQMLRHIHDLRFDGAFGFLGDNPLQRAFSLPGLAPVSTSWAGFFQCDSVAQHYLSTGYLAQEEAEVLAALPDRLSRSLGRAEPRLLHMGDIMHNGNMILDRASGRIRAVIDYADSTAGDPAWELAWVKYYFADYPFARPAFDLDRFWEGYGARPDSRDPLSRFYLMAILLFEKLRFYDPASARGRWAIATVKGILRTFA